MLRKNPSGDFPVVHQSAYVDQTAIICGKVIIEENVFIGPYAVIRADEVDSNGNIEPIIIHSNSNVQDGVVIHSKSGASVIIGHTTSIAHRAIIHGPCAVGDNVFIGFNTVLFNCSVGNHCAIRHNSVIESCTLDDNFFIPSTTHVNCDTDLTQFSNLDKKLSDFSEDVARTNISLVAGYKKLSNEF